MKQPERYKNPTTPICTDLSRKTTPTCTDLSRNTTPICTDLSRKNLQLKDVY